MDIQIVNMVHKIGVARKNVSDKGDGVVSGKEKRDGHLAAYTLSDSFSRDAQNADVTCQSAGISRNPLVIAEYALGNSNADLNEVRTLSQLAKSVDGHAKEYQISQTAIAHGALVKSMGETTVNDRRLFDGSFDKQSDVQDDIGFTSGKPITSILIPTSDILNNNSIASMIQYNDQLVVRTKPDLTAGNVADRVELVPGTASNIAVTNNLFKIGDFTFAVGNNASIVGNTITVRTAAKEDVMNDIATTINSLALDPDTYPAFEGFYAYVDSTTGSPTTKSLFIGRTLLDKKAGYGITTVAPVGSNDNFAQIGTGGSAPTAITAGTTVLASTYTPYISYGNGFVSQEVTFSLGNLTASSAAGKMIEVFGISINIGAAATTADSITVTAGTPDTVGNAIIGSNGFGNASITRDFQVSYDSEKESVTVVLRSKSSLAEAQGEVVIDSNSAQYLTKLSIGEIDHSAELNNATTTISYDAVASEGPVSTVSENTTIQFTESPSDGESFVINGVTFEVIATGTPTDTSSKLQFLSTADGVALSKAMATKINDPKNAAHAKLGDMGLVAKADDKGKLSMVFADVTGKMTSVPFIIKSTDKSINSVFIEGKAQGKAIAAADKNLAINFHNKEVVEMRVPTVYHASKGQVELINSMDGQAGISLMTRSMLKSQRANIVDGNFQIQSSISGTAGQISITDSMTGITKISDTIGSAVHSLATSAVRVQGNVIGNMLVFNPNAIEPSTGYFTIDPTKIQEGAIIRISNADYRLTASPSQDTDIKLAVYTDSTGNAIVDIPETYKRIATFFETQNSNLFFANVQADLQLKQDGSTALNLSTHNLSYVGLEISFLASPTDTAPYVVTINKNSDSPKVETYNIQNNPGFIGKISPDGVKATFISQNVVELSITSPNSDIVYTGRVGNTNPNKETAVLLEANDREKGGAFMITLQAEGGMVVSNTAQANIYASNVYNALSGLTFTQNRSITSYKNNSSSLLENSTATMINDDFNSIRNTRDVKVTQEEIIITFNDDMIFSSDIRNAKIQGGTHITLYRGGDSSSNQKIKLYMPRDINLETEIEINDFQAALRKAFGAGQEGIVVRSASSGNVIFEASIPNLITKLEALGDFIQAGKLDEYIDGLEVLQAEFIDTQNRISAHREEVDKLIGFLEELKDMLENASKDLISNDQAKAIALLQEAKSTLSALIQVFRSVLEQNQQTSESLLQVIR